MMRWSLLVLCSVCACVKTAPPPDFSNENKEHRFSHAEDWAAAFEDPTRDDWQKPDEVLKALALPPNAKVADIGAATGYFTVRFARALPEGTVYGIDVESSMVEYLTKRAQTEALPNVKVVLAAYDDPKIPEPVDLIIVVNTYHHISDRTAYFAGLFKSLKPTGRIAIIDFAIGSKRGPADSAKVDPSVVTKELLAAGFKSSASFPILTDQYFLVFGR